MTKEVQDALFHIAELIGAGIVGGLIVAFASHRLTIGRDRSSGKSTRKTEFLSFMRAWKVAVGQTHLGPGGFWYDSTSISDSVAAFAALAESIRGDLRGESSKRFAELVGKIVSFTGGELHRKGGHEEVQAVFDEIIALVERA